MNAKSNIVDKSRLLNTRQAADYLNLSPSTLSQQRHTRPVEGHIPFVPYIRLGRNIKYDLNDLDQWIQENRVGE